MWKLRSFWEDSDHLLISSSGGVTGKGSQRKRAREGLFKHGKGPPGLHLQQPPIVLLFVSSWVAGVGEPMALHNICRHSSTGPQRHIITHYRHLWQKHTFKLQLHPLPPLPHASHLIFFSSYVLQFNRCQPGTPPFNPPHCLSLILPRDYKRHTHNWREALWKHLIQMQTLSLRIYTFCKNTNTHKYY